MFTFLIGVIVQVLAVLLVVALVTLLERKVLGISQKRKGPNKVLLEGIGQPFSDALKLFFKELVLPFRSNVWIFKSGPVVSLFLMVLLWVCYPSLGLVLGFSFSSFLFLMLLSLGIYPLFFSGWASDSKYAMIGSLRGIAQTISYEISLALIFFNFLFFSSTCSVGEMGLVVSELSLFSVCPFMLFLWGVSCVAECNRTPFDFSEGESELVSGFNIEYGAGGFTLIFLAEYGMIVFFSGLSISLCFGNMVNYVGFVLGWVFLLFVWCWVRSTLPRYRYDKLMNLAWKSILPAVLFFTPFTIVLCVVGG